MNELGLKLQEIRETHSPIEANELLQEGWIYLNSYTKVINPTNKDLGNHLALYYSLGLPVKPLF